MKMSELAFTCVRGVHRMLLQFIGLSHSCTNEIITTHEVACVPVLILVLSVCMCVYMSDDVGSPYLHVRYISTVFGSSSYVKVVGSRSRSQEPRR